MTDHAEASVDRAYNAALPGSEPMPITVKLLTNALLAEGWTPPARPPLKTEPTDLAARVVDKDGDVWACVPSVGWLCASTPDTRDWHELLREFSPLHLYTSKD